MTTNTELDELEIIAVTRDLFRKPHVKALAVALARFNGAEATKESVPPIYIMMANRLITHKADRIALLHLIDMLIED